MSYFILFVIFAFTSVTHAKAIDSTSSCATHLDKLDKCAAVLSFSGDCYSSIVNFSDTEYAKCTTSSIFWSYPLNNVTLIIATPFTQQHQPYTLRLDNEQLMSTVSHVYRIVDEHETEITTHEKILTQQSDGNFQIILKLQGPTHLSRYGVNIDYSSVPAA